MRVGRPCTPNTGTDAAHAARVIICEVLCHCMIGRDRRQDWEEAGEPQAGPTAHDRSKHHATLFARHTILRTRRHGINDMV
jgi:hypothetical protein